MPRKSVLAERPVGGVAQTNVIWRLGIIVRSLKTFRLSILHALDGSKPIDLQGCREKRLARPLPVKFR